MAQSPNLPAKSRIDVNDYFIKYFLKLCGVIHLHLPNRKFKNRLPVEGATIKFALPGHV